MKIALTIAGFDGDAGAGLQADLKTLSAFGVYGITVATAITVQNTTGVSGVWPLPPSVVAAQIDALAADFDLAAVKTGMLLDAGIVEVVAAKVAEHRIPNLVVDPIILSKNGFSLLDDQALEAIKMRLLPVTHVLMPNLDEAAHLVGRHLGNLDDVRAAARTLHRLGPANVVIKGGHLDEEATDVLFDGAGFREFRSAKLPGGQVHGTGCALSAALAAQLALDVPLPEAFCEAKRYVTKAIEGSLALGHGYRLIDHFAVRGK